MHAHVSAVLNASRCYLKPDTQKTLAAIFKASLAESQSGTSTISKSLKFQVDEFNWESPYCHCTVDPKLCIICMSRSEKYPEHNYFY